MRGGGSKISLSLLMVSEIRLQQPSCLLCLLAPTEGHIQCLDCSNQLSQSNFLPFLLPKRLLQSNLLPPHPLSHIWPYVRFVSRKGNFRWDPHALTRLSSLSPRGGSGRQKEREAPFNATRPSSLTRSPRHHRN